jgi:hypothetical protein
VDADDADCLRNRIPSWVRDSSTERGLSECLSDLVIFSALSPKKGGTCTPSEAIPARLGSLPHPEGLHTPGHDAEEARNALLEGGCRSIDRMNKTIVLFRPPLPNAPSKRTRVLTARKKEMGWEYRAPRYS